MVYMYLGKRKHIALKSTGTFELVKLLATMADHKHGNFDERGVAFAKASIQDIRGYTIATEHSWPCRVFR